MDFTYMLHTFYLSLRGIPSTLGIAVASIVFASPFAFFFAWVRLKQIPVLSTIIRIYVALIRSTPLILMILMFYSILPSALNVLILKLGLGFDIFKLPPIFLAILVFVLLSTGSLSEVFRSALSGVEIGQFEAGVASGLSVWQVYRRILFPQALVSAIPPLTNLLIQLVKGTSLVFVMTVKDITAIAKTQAAFGYRYTESYLVIFVLYILLCTSIQFVSRRLEAKFTLQEKIKKRNRLEQENVNHQAST